MGKHIITMESLVEFCKTHETFSYSAKETGHPLVVSTYGSLEYSPSEDNGLMQVFLRACHTGLNRNGSYISDEDMTRAIPSFANKPILAEIRENSKGEIDFGTHAITTVEDENGEEKDYYIEKPVGIIPESNDAHLVYDEKKKKSYLYTKGYIFTLYGNETAEILERRNGTDVSIEIDISEFAWDAKNKWLTIKEFVFNGVTLLGSDWNPGMENSRCELSDFSHYETFDYSKEINEMKSRLKLLEQRFSIETKEGGNAQIMGKFEELLKRYNKNAEDITFDYSELSDEELEAKFAELFDDPDPSSEGNTDTSEGGETTETGSESNSDTSTSESESESEATSESETPSEETGIPAGSKADDDEVAGSTTKKKTSNDFALSLQEKINALSNLVSVTYEDADNEWYCTLVYEDYVVMIGYFKGQCYKQNYTSDNDEFTLVGDRVQVYEQFLTQEEMDSLDEMRSNYSELKQFKADFEQKELENARNEIINDDRFEIIRDTEAYKELVKDVTNYSVEELETKLKIIVADNIIGNGNFSKFSKQEKGRMFTIPSKEVNPLETNYGGIFDDKN